MMTSDTATLLSIQEGCTEFVEGVKRRYNASRRQEQAQANRQRIISAAQALFVDKGYGRTTIADIAGAAGVAVETVYAAFRNKPGLLHHVWDVAVGGDEQDVHLLDRPDMRAVFAEPDLGTRLTRFARVNTVIMRRTAPLLRALRGAAASEAQS
jgi:AcrR family transcriptional regulator